MALICLVAQLAARAEGGGSWHFAEGVVSTPKTKAVTFSPDGATVYLARYLPVEKISMLMVSFFDGGEWSDPQQLPFSRYNEGGPSLSPAGNRLFFWSQRPTKGKPAQSCDLWYVDVSRLGMSEPRPLSEAEDGTWQPTTIGLRGVSIASNGTVFSCREGTPPRLVCLRWEDGAYSKETDLGDAINGTEGGFDPYIDPDMRYLLFASRRVHSSGESDIYVSYYREGIWSEPENLGQKVNTLRAEYAPSVTPDGVSLIFTRADTGIFIVPLAELEFRRDLIGPAKARRSHYSIR